MELKIHYILIWKLKILVYEKVNMISQMIFYHLCPYNMQLGVVNAVLTDYVYQDVEFLDFYLYFK